MIDKVMLYLKSGKHRVKAAVLLTVLLAVSWNLFAAENPIPLKQSNAGWLFAMPDGTTRFCARSSETTAQCVDQIGNQYSCAFRNPPVYFNDCKPSEGIE